MAITLQTVAAPGATPITPNATSAKYFANNYAKLSAPNISMRERKAVIVLAMVYVLASTGADYRSNHRGLIQDTQVYTGGISHFDVFAALAATSVGAANTIDPTFSLNLETILKDGKDITQLSDETLDRIIGFLGAQLGL